MALFSLTPSLPPSLFPHPPGNPVLIPSEIVKGLRQGARQDHPSLTVFGSGDPQPAVQNYSWFFNDEPLFINGSEVDGVDEQYLSVDFDSVVLRRVIEPSVGGVYRSVVSTSAGEVNATIVFNVECEWSNLSVALMKYTNIHVHVAVCTVGHYVLPHFPPFLPPSLPLYLPMYFPIYLYNMYIPPSLSPHIWWSTLLSLPPNPLDSSSYGVLDSTLYDTSMYICQ